MKHLTMDQYVGFFLIGLGRQTAWVYQVIGVYVEENTNILLFFPALGLYIEIKSYVAHF